MTGFNFINEIKKGALLSVSVGDKKNVMTVSWGGCGFLFGREVSFIFIRPERYTYDFLEKSDSFTLSFMNEEKKDAVAYCGRVSGKDCDKFKECALDFRELNNNIFFEGARVTLVMEKIYSDFFRQECFADKECLSFYKNGGFHKMYICKIKEIKIGKG